MSEFYRITEQTKRDPYEGDRRVQPSRKWRERWCVVTYSKGEWTVLHDDLSYASASLVASQEAPH